MPRVKQTPYCPVSCGNLNRMMKERDRKMGGNPFKALWPRPNGRLQKVSVRPAVAGGRVYFSDTLFRLTRCEPLKVCLHLTGRSERGIITGICFGCPSSGFKVNHVEGLGAPPLPAGLSGARQEESREVGQMTYILPGTQSCLSADCFSCLWVRTSLFIDID